MTTDPYNIRWKTGNTIRQIATGKPMLVIDVKPRLATLVVPLESNESLTTTQVILFRDYADWAMDEEMELDVKKNNSFEWHFRALVL